MVVCVKFDTILLIFLFYKIFNALQNKHFSLKTILIRIFYIHLQQKFINCFGINFTIMGRFGVTEILIILAVVLLLFGGKKIPELMKGLGSGIKEFKNAAKDDQPTAKKEEEVK